MHISKAEENGCGFRKERAGRFTYQRPLNEKDIDCYLYAMKLKDSNSKDILEYFIPSIYQYAIKEGTSGENIKLEYVSIPSNSPVCDVNSIGDTVEKLSSGWLKKCYSSPPNEVDLKDYLKKCGNYDIILMRQWDYLKDSDSPVILYISYNGDGRVLVTRCEIKIVNGEIKRTYCANPVT